MSKTDRATPSDFRLFFETAPAAVLVLAPDRPRFTILAASDAYLRATRTSRDNIIGRGIFEVFPDDPADLSSTGGPARTSFERVLDTGAPDAMAVQKHSIRRPDAEGGGFEERYWSPVNSPVIGERGEVLCIHHRVEDVTELVRQKQEGVEQEAVAELLRTREMEADVARRGQELQEVNRQLRAANRRLEEVDRANALRAEEALRQSEARYRSLFEYIDEGFCIIEVLFEGETAVDYRFVDVNPAFERHTGLKGAVGRGVRELVPGHEEHWFRIYGEVARSGEPVRFQNPADALGRYYDVYAFRVGAPSERRVAVLFNDISARKRAEARLTELNARLVEADRRKDEFLGMLSHELRNPLAPIRNALWILDRAEPTGEHAHRARDIATRQVAHLTRLVDDLLDVTRIARGKIELRRADVDLAALASRTAEDYRALMQDRELQLTVDVPREAVVVNGDETRLAQVLGNLLSNAAKFTPAGGRVTLGLHADGGKAAIRVRDTGAGVEPELLETMFEPFTQGRQTLARSDGGLGLGLALVRGLVALHGGEVTAVSGGAGRGTDFVVTLPLVSLASRDCRAEGDAGVRAATPRRRVLIVDDNRDAAETLAQLVELLGHEVEVVFDGPSAVERARVRPPEVVLCDLGLPGMDGFTVARTLRAGGAAGLRLYAVSGYAQPGDVASAVAAGFDGHLAKPLEPEKLARILA